MNIIFATIKFRVVFGVFDCNDLGLIKTLQFLEFEVNDCDINFEAGISIVKFYQR